MTVLSEKTNVELLKDSIHSLISDINASIHIKELPVNIDTTIYYNLILVKNFDVLTLELASMINDTYIDVQDIDLKNVDYNNLKKMVDYDFQNGKATMDIIDSLSNLVVELDGVGERQQINNFRVNQKGLHTLTSLIDNIKLFNKGKEAEKEKCYAGNDGKNEVIQKLINIDHDFLNNESVLKSHYLILFSFKTLYSKYDIPLSKFILGYQRERNRRKAGSNYCVFGKRDTSALSRRERIRHQREKEFRNKANEK